MAIVKTEIARSPLIPEDEVHYVVMRMAIIPSLSDLRPKPFPILYTKNINVMMIKRGTRMPHDQSMYPKKEGILTF